MTSITRRLDQITHIPADCLREDPPPPKSLKIELSSRCNYRCKYCSLAFRCGHVAQDMPLSLFRWIARSAVELGVTEIGPFLIGEPFSSPDNLVYAIHHLKHSLSAPYVFLTSNASLAKPEHVDKCMLAGLDSLKWSCNFSDHDQFASLTGVSPRLFDAALENIRLAHEHREASCYPTRLYASSILYDSGQPERMKFLLERHILPYVDAHYWLPLYSMGGVAADTESSLGYRPIAGNAGRIDAPVDPIPCWTLFTAAHVLSDGRMTACCADGMGDWTVGDLTRQSFMDAWHSPFFRELRRAHLSGDIRGTKCERCALAGE